MRSQVKALPSIVHRPSFDEEDSYPGRLHTIQRKLKFGSNTIVKSNTTSESYSLNKRQKQPPLTESQILRQIDSKLEMHKKDIDQRNDMIITIERGFENVKQELLREKQINEEKSKQLLELQSSYHAVQLKLKQLADSAPSPSLHSAKDRERIQQLEQALKAREQRENELAQQVETLKAQLNEFASQAKGKEDLIEEIKRLRDSVSQIKAKSETQVSELKQTISKEQNEKNGLKKQMEYDKKDADLKDSIKTKDLNAALASIKQFESEISTLKDALKKSKDSDQSGKLLEQISSLKSQFTEASKSYEAKINLQSTQLEQQQKSISELSLQADDLKQKIIENTKLLKDKNDLLESYKNQKAQTESLLSNAKSDICTLNQQIEELSAQVGQQKSLRVLNDTIVMLEKSDKEIQKNLSCTFCNKFIKQPVTVIPCGHSYCFDCKKGYSKECSKCGPKLKVEAMYRNELLDDIIEMVKLLQQSIVSLKLVTK